MYIGLIRSRPTCITWSGRNPASISHCDSCMCLLFSLTKNIDLGPYSWSYVEYVHYTTVQVQSYIRTTITHYWVPKKWWGPDPTPRKITPMYGCELRSPSEWNMRIQENAKVYLIRLFSKCRHWAMWNMTISEHQTWYQKPCRKHVYVLSAFV